MHQSCTLCCKCTFLSRPMVPQHLSFFPLSSHQIRSWASTSVESLITINQPHAIFWKLHQTLPLTQNGHNRCALFTFPQAEHLLRAVTSLSAFPAMNRWRFFLCDVFFFGTARNTDSHSPSRIDGIPRRMAIGAPVGICNNGCISCCRRGAVLDGSG